MSKTRKVVVFVVEGISDEIILQSLKHFLLNKEIRFAVVHGDIITDENTSALNIKTKINSVLTRLLMEKSLLKKDISQIIHVVDSDGTYIPDTHIVEVIGSQTVYEEDKIICATTHNIAIRNHKKQKILNLLVGLSAISKIPYSVYYFSCNLDHFFHNNANLKSQLKREYAEKLDAHFARNPDDFKKFLTTQTISSNLDYTQSWEYLKDALNSLSRHTNVNLLFDARAKHGFLFQSENSE